MKLIYTFVSMMMCYVASSQVPSYCIYLMSGDITVSAKGKQPEKARINQFLTDNQELKLGNKAQLTLVNKDSKYLVLNTAGTYQVGALSQNLKNYPPGVTQKYVSLLWKDLVASQDNFSAVRKSASAGVIGGVHRGDDCGVLVFPSPGMRTSNDDIRFIWKKNGKGGEYELSVSDDQMNEILTRPVSDTQVNLVISRDLKGMKGRMYWSIRPRAMPSCEIEASPFDLASNDEADKAVATERDFLAKNDPIDQLSVIDQLIKDGWVYKAFRFYDILVRNNPGNRMISGQYAMLLLQYGFSKEAEEVYNLSK